MPRRPLTRRWTPEEISLLSKLLREGEDLHRIARKLKRSASVVRLQKRKLAQSQRRPSERFEAR
jgi:DNA-binding NarL/FixJ family response regulator